MGHVLVKTQFQSWLNWVGFLVFVVTLLVMARVIGS